MKDCLTFPSNAWLLVDVHGLDKEGIFKANDLLYDLLHQIRAAESTENVIQIVKSCKRGENEPMYSKGGVLPCAILLMERFLACLRTPLVSNASGSKKKLIFDEDSRKYSFEVSCFVLED